MSRTTSHNENSASKEQQNLCVSYDLATHTTNNGGTPSLPSEIFALIQMKKYLSEE